MQLNYRARLIDYPKWYRYSLRPISAAEIGKMRRKSKRAQKRAQNIIDRITSESWFAPIESESDD